MKLAIARIRAGSTTQVRARIDMPTVEQYAEDMRNGASFPPLTVFAENLTENFMLADGFHRLAAAKMVGVGSVEVQILVGGPHEALLYALGCNATHGLRRTNADKTRAVELALKNPSISKMSLREIASICRVSHMTVSRIRNAQSPERKKERKHHVTELQKASRQAALYPLRKALKIIKAFPYGGEDIERLNLNEDDIDGLEYMADWLEKAVVAIAAQNLNAKVSS